MGFFALLRVAFRKYDDMILHYFNTHVCCTVTLFVSSFFFLFFLDCSCLRSPDWPLDKHVDGTQQ